MRCLITKFAVAGLVTTTALSVSVSGAKAADFSVTQDDNFNDLLNVLLGDTTGLSSFSGSVEGDARAFGVFEDDPFGLESGVVLSTGLAEEIPGENTVDSGSFALADLSTDLGEPGIGSNTFDTATLTINFEADPTVENLFFQYVFGSEEFLEFAGSNFNDFFTLKLNGENLALLDDSIGTDDIVSINNLANTDVSPNVFSSEYVDNPAAPGTLTKLDGYTVPLTFQGDVLTGLNTLEIQISDVADGVLDSAVFIKAGTLGTRDIVDPIGVPEPSSVLTLLTLGVLGAGFSLHRHRLN